LNTFCRSVTETNVLCEGQLEKYMFVADLCVAIAVKLGRLKDLARVQTFLEQGAVDLVLLRGVLERHDLMSNWRIFFAKAAIADPLQTT
jgi:hypothetical protein